MIMTACNCCLAGMFGCGMAGSFQQLLAWRWVTGLGSALQMSGSQLCLADISRADNRARCLGTNQACTTVIVQSGIHDCDIPYVTVWTLTQYHSVLLLHHSQLCLADISRPDNMYRASCLGTNQACTTIQLQTGIQSCDNPKVVLLTPNRKDKEK